MVLNEHFIMNFECIEWLRDENMWARGMCECVSTWWVYVVIVRDYVVSVCDCVVCDECMFKYYVECVCEYEVSAWKYL